MEFAKTKILNDDAIIIIIFLIRRENDIIFRCSSL